MNDKTKLIQSMQNLIYHLALDHTQQSQIFNSFTPEDLSKIIANLSDSNSDLRKINLSLIAVLLHNNPQIQHDFCQKMNIDFAPGKLVLTWRLQKVGMNYGSIYQVFRLIKDEIPQNQKKSLYWYIQFKNQQPSLIYSSSHAPAIDPATQISGIILQNHQPRIQNPPKILTSSNPTGLPINHKNMKTLIIGSQSDRLRNTSQNKALRNKNLNYEIKYENLNEQTSHPNKGNQLLNYQQSEATRDKKDDYSPQTRRISCSSIQNKTKFIQIISHPIHLASRQNKMHPRKIMRPQHH